MKSSNVLLAATTVLFIGAAAYAAHVDFNDPRRALGREDDIRIDAQLFQDSVSSNSPLNVTYQVENLSKATIAVADKVCDVSYDNDTQTLTFSIGAEVPSGANMPHLVAIKPGEKRTFSAMGTTHVAMPTARTPWSAVPRYVQIKVNLIKDVTPFAELIAKQTATVAPPLPGDMFDKWVNSVDAVFLNPIPVRWTGNAPNAMSGVDASRSAPPPAGGNF